MRRKKMQSRKEIGGLTEQTNRERITTSPRGSTKRRCGDLSGEDRFNRERTSLRRVRKKLARLVK